MINLEDNISSERVSGLDIIIITNCCHDQYLEGRKRVDIITQTYVDSCPKIKNKDWMKTIFANMQRIYFCCIIWREENDNFFKTNNFMAIVTIKTEQEHFIWQYWLIQIVHIICNEPFQEQTIIQSTLNTPIDKQCCYVKVSANK